MINPENTSSPMDRLSEARLKQWHQNGEAVLTFENIRSWINAAGLVLFAPRPQIAAPAPSMVEAMLGASTTAPTLQQIAEARGLLARLIGEGLAVPLNLLGSPTGIGTDTPDFIASSAVFSYIFTLRGDKAWKQPPVLMGPTKVSNLALAAYELIRQRHAMTAPELTTELGKEVTESAVLRALTELWAHLRVLPLPQADGTTMWELASTRYTKQIKAGANAGVPTALSALISLYLGQSLIATEGDIETFLSPVAPRSRIRDVVHALLAARQLDAYTIEGRSFLHVAGAAPGFLRDEAESAEAESGVEEQTQGEEQTAGEEDGSRIKKFIPKPRKVGTGYLTKAKPAAFSARPPSRPKFERRDEGSGERRPRPERSDRERRPFQRPRDEDREQTPFRRTTRSDEGREARGSDRRGTQDRPKRPFGPRSGREQGFERRPRRTEGEGRPYKSRSYDRPRAEEQGAPERPTYRRFDEPRPKRGSKPFGQERRPRREEGRPPQPTERDRGPRPFTQERRPRAGEEGRPPRPVDRERGGRPNRSGERPDRRNSGERSDRRDRASSSDRPPRPAFGERQRPRDRAPSGDRSDRRNFGERPDRRDRGSSSERSNRREFGGGERRGTDRPFANRGGKPSGKFGSAKPFGKKPGQKAGPPPRKFRPREDESA